MSALSVLWPVSYEAQPKGEFENLQVLPSDMDKRRLMDVMKGFTRALGVRCQHCHVGEEGMPLSEFDFVSDDKRTKEVARTMLRMTRDINEQFIAGLPGASSGAHVSCETCHHGLARPRTLEQELASVIAEGGADAGVARYRELREELYGRSSFDFSEGSLNRLAQRLAAEDELDAAAAIIGLNVEQYPRSASAHYLAAEIALRRGDRDAAAAGYRKVLELRPGDPGARARLEELSKR